MRLGARIFKTGIAIILAMSIASLLPDNIGLKTLAGVSAVVAMQPSVYRSIKTVSEQAIGNVIGALLAVTMVTIFNNNFISWALPLFYSLQFCSNLILPM